MHGLVVVIFLLMNAFSSALGEILIPVTDDPYLIWIWAGPAVALLLQTIIFIFRFRSINKDEFMTFDDEQSETVNSTDETNYRKRTRGRARSRELSVRVSTSYYTMDGTIVMSLRHYVDQLEGMIELMKNESLGGSSTTWTGQEMSM